MVRESAFVHMHANPRHRDRRNRISDGPPKVPCRKESLRQQDEKVVDHDAFFLETCPPPEKLESIATEEASAEEAASIGYEEMTSGTETIDTPSANVAELIGSEVELEAAILARIPAHIRSQLSQEEWCQILESDSGFADGSDGCSVSFCSDITDDVSEFLSSRTKAGASKEALHLQEEGIKTVEPDDPIVMSEPEQPQQDGRRRVSFGNVRIRTHERILEVHPCTSSGPSLGLGWMYEDEVSPKSIDWLENNRGASKIRLSRDKRERIVREELGYSSREIALAIRECLRLKNQRRRTINNLKECNSIVPVEKVEYLVERCHRKMRSIRKRFRIPSASAA